MSLRACGHGPAADSRQGRPGRNPIPVTVAMGHRSLVGAGLVPALAEGDHTGRPFRKTSWRGGRSCPWLQTAVLMALLGLSAACAGTPGPDEGAPGRSPAPVRAERRAYDGAPPVIPHLDFGSACTECHGERGVEVAGVGFSPPSPHEATQGLSALSRCRQCHVEKQTDSTFQGNSFAGLRQDLRRGRRLYDQAPPVMPHPVFMRENCAACHSGPAAREEIRTPHPERQRCNQCHVPQQTATLFRRER